MMGFEHLVPGWENRVAYPYNVPIEAGIRSEISRLQGALYLVVVLQREYDYDGLFEQISLDSGFVDPLEAVHYAQLLMQSRCQAIASQNPHWRPMAASCRWPSHETKGKKLLRLEPGKYGAGAGFNSWEVHVAVIPLDPTTPLSASLFATLDKTSELNAYFGQLGKVGTRPKVRH